MYMSDTMLWSAFRQHVVQFSGMYSLGPPCTCQLHSWPSVFCWFMYYALSHCLCRVCCFITVNNNPVDKPMQYMVDSQQTHPCVSLWSGRPAAYRRSQAEHQVSVEGSRRERRRRGDAGHSQPTHREHTLVMCVIVSISESTSLAFSLVVWLWNT